MIEAHHLTKRYGEKLAVDQLSFSVRPGVVTGFLGPNGSGKSTTMRMRPSGRDVPPGSRRLPNTRPDGAADSARGNPEGIQREHRGRPV